MAAMHYETRLLKGHNTVNNRLNLVTNLIDEAPDMMDFKAETSEEVLAFELEDLRAQIGRWKSQIRDLDHIVQFGATEEDQAAAEERSDVLRGRVGRVELVVRLMEKAGYDSLNEAQRLLFKEKLRIERYARWHERAKGRNPVRRRGR